MADPSAPAPDDGAAYSIPPPGLTLAQINRAIAAVETGGQMYRLGDRQLLRGDLRWLYPERARLETLVRNAARAAAGITVRRIVPYG